MSSLTVVVVPSFLASEAFTPFARAAVTWSSSSPSAGIFAAKAATRAFCAKPISYPSRPGRLGKVVELRDLTVRSAGEAWEITEAAFRSGNARRRSYS
jgi:hypothetical protein